MNGFLKTYWKLSLLAILLLLSGGIVGFIVGFFSGETVYRWAFDRSATVFWSALVGLGTLATAFFSILLNIRYKEQDVAYRKFIDTRDIRYKCEYEEAERLREMPRLVHVMQGALETSRLILMRNITSNAAINLRVSSYTFRDENGCVVYQSGEPKVSLMGKDGGANATFIGGNETIRVDYVNPRPMVGTFEFTVYFNDIRDRKYRVRVKGFHSKANTFPDYYETEAPILFH